MMQDNNTLPSSIDNREYNLSELYYLIRNNIKSIIIISIVIVFFVSYYTLVSKPIYKSSSTILINDEHTSPISMLDIGMGNDRNHLENEIQILESRTITELVVDRLLASEYRDNLYLFGTKAYKPVYYRKYLTLGLLDRFQETVDLSSDFNSRLKEQYIKKLNKSLSVSNKRGTDALTISIVSLNPTEASLICNTLVDVYKESDLEWVTGEMTHLKSFLIEQLEEKEIELNQIEKELKDFQEREKIFGVDENSRLTLENLTKFESEYNNMLAGISIINEREIYFNEQLTSEEKDFSNKLSNTISDRLAALKNEMRLIEIELVSVSTQYKDNHNAVTDLKSKLIKLQMQVDEESDKLISDGISSADPLLYRQGLMDSLISIQFTKANLESKTSAYKKIIDNYDTKLSALPEKVLEYTRLERNRSIVAETYGFMRKKLEEARIGEASKIGQIRVIDQAIPNRIPISPNKSFNFIIGIILGLGLGVIFVVIKEIFDNTIKSIEQLERRGLSILGIIPAIDARQNNKNKKTYLKNNRNVDKLQRRLITHEDPKSPISEAYRSLRTSLTYYHIENKCKVILVSSVGPGEGKTTTIANLAITYANLGKKTLLIDSDLRKPVIHDVFKVDKTPGLTSFLCSDSKFDDIIKSTEINNLDIVTSGVIPPNPSELLDSKPMLNFINEAKKKYDVVLFDSPPLIAVTDAYVLLKNIDRFLLVVRAGVTERGGLQRVLTAIKNSNINLTGTILNAVTEEHSYGAGYYYNYYQYYYGDSEKS